ncbi:MAG: MCP four helix bundle domain-containing protein [Bryobacterales bacterium]|nr:MCP four helix bundle domain-containing protein [Bryobacterales bacterium]
MKVSTKLYASVFALLLAGLLVAGFGTWYLRSLSNELDEAVNKTAIKLDQVNSLRARTWEMVGGMRGTFVYASLKNQAKLDEAMNDWKTAYKRSGEIIAEIRPLLVSEEGKKMLAKMEALLADYEKVSTEYMQFCKDGKQDQVATIAVRVGDLVGELDKVGLEFRNLQMALLKQTSAHSDSLRYQSSLVNIAFSCLMIAVGIVTVFVVRAINKTLVQVVGQLDEGAEQVASAASQVSSSSQSLAEGSSEQAASLEETSASSEEINSMARKNSENSRVAADLMSQSQQKFVQANQSLDQSVIAMGEINTQSDKISKIIKVIDEIAFQTNILALNAAVEAARAGEAGMGFAVVADEVRNLAQRCAQAAKDTAELIEESIAKSNDGKIKVDQVATVIRTITEETARVKTLVDEVNLGSQEQARGIEQIAHAITQMEQVTQKTAASAEESASASEELTAQSETLKDIVDRLTAMVGGGNNAHRSSRKSARGSRFAGAGSADTGHSVHALGKAVSHKTAHPQESAVAPKAHAHKSIPLDDEFTEF